MNETVKLNLIGETAWKETLAAHRSLSEEQIRDLSKNEPMNAEFALFSELRNCIIESLPNDLSEKELTRQVYFRTCGEPLPDDFFKD